MSDVNFICDNCGLDDVEIRSWSKWDKDNQVWVTDGIITEDVNYARTAYCNSCQEAVVLVEIPLTMLGDDTIDIEYEDGC